MIHEVQFKIDSDQLSGYTDEYLATLWHIAQANPAEDNDRSAGDLAERVGREIISRFIKAAPIPLWTRQGSDFYFKELQAARAAGAECQPAAAPTADSGRITQAVEALSSFEDPANWVTIPETTLPGGRVVPAFQMSRFPVAQDDNGNLVLSASLPPLVNISYHAAAQLCASAGVQMSRESQELAVRHDAALQGANWTNGTVGDGTVFQGLHKGTFSSAQPPARTSAAPSESQFLQLSTGEKIYGLAGNVYTWTHDDVQGDERGLVKDSLAADSISLTTAPFPSMEKGMGYRPDGARSWSGHALIRGGYWYDGDDAGVFALNFADPGVAGGNVGFRCTKPISGL